MSECSDNSIYRLAKKKFPDPPSRFKLVRHTDHTGVSGEGTVAYGIMWSDGSLTLRWNGQYSSLVHWREIEHLLAVHGHDGATEIQWIDKTTFTIDGRDDEKALHQWETNGGPHGDTDD